jgi:IMP cyclohydrolase
MFTELAAKNLARIKKNPYPGRGIIIGMTTDRTKMILLYWLMGRSENSRNRIFAEEPDGIRTKAYDPAKLTDPSLVIYWPTRQSGSVHFVTNGDQTDTLCRLVPEGKSFEDALMTREFEPDPPNWTPRISGMTDVADPLGSYRLSILKAQDGNPECCVRCFYRYDKAIQGFGHCIHTYQGDGNPLPTFTGDPFPVPVPDTAEEAAAFYWPLLNKDNRVALFARTMDRVTGAVETSIINRHAALRPEAGK